MTEEKYSLMQVESPFGSTTYLKPVRHGAGSTSTEDEEPGWRLG